jgi:hypothetical protein
LASIGETIAYRSLFADVIHELLAGHARATQELIKNVPNQYFTLEGLLTGVDALARDSAATQQLLTCWARLSEWGLKVLHRLLLQRNILLHDHASQDYEQLIVFGIAAIKSVKSQQYLTFKSWYAELIARYHYGQLGISDERLQRLHIADIMPEIRAVNVEAYRVICDIESAARNLVTLVLSQNSMSDVASKDNNLEDMLHGFVLRLENNGKQVDLASRAKLQRDMSETRQMNTRINSLMAYISTGDLRDLIGEISRTHQLNHWKAIEDDMQHVSTIRNAVMHNQLIDENALRRLYRLQGNIYDAFSNNTFAKMGRENSGFSGKV